MYIDQNCFGKRISSAPKFVQIWDSLTFLEKWLNPIKVLLGTYIYTKTENKIQENVLALSQCNGYILLIQTDMIKISDCADVGLHSHDKLTRHAVCVELVQLSLISYKMCKEVLNQDR